MSCGIISRKEEERNEKIIRGLMKLPPNRRCINCNSLGPQYVCTNFWTFVCTTCSGIHREFTHRVKSVSMSKFTSKEVEALQNGGNQRARDIYLKEWDLQRQRLPDSSNAERVRDFIKNVYMDKRYAGGKATDKPPRDLQNPRNHEDETRRASSYHSYSQSPPYDYQYEERRYGKQGAVLTRKPGSDRGHYEAKISSFAYSPGSLGEQTNEDSFANETSGSRVSDTQSPNYPKDTGFGSPSKFKGVTDGIRGPQRATSAGSFGSFDSNSTSFKSEPEQSVGIHQDKISTSVKPLRSNLSTAPIVSQPVTSAASTIDLFQLPASPPAVDLFQSHSLSGQPKTYPYTSLKSFFETSQEQSTANLVKSSPQLSLPKDEGWATFEIPQAIASKTDNEYIKPNDLSSTISDPIVKSDSMSYSNVSMQWPSFQNSNIQGASSSITTPWHDGFQQIQPSLNTSAAQSWNAFEDSVGTHPSENTQQSSQQLDTALPSSYTNQYLNKGVPENFCREGAQRYFTGSGSTSLPPYAVSGSSVAPPQVPYMCAQSPATEMKSTNPFDVPLDSDSELSNMFLDMSSLQAALPNASLQPSFLGEVSEPWFPQNPGTPYIPTTAQGGLSYLAGHTPTSQLPNVPTQGSFGGNPFA